MQLVPRTAYNMLRNFGYPMAKGLVIRDYQEGSVAVLERTKHIMNTFSEELKVGVMFDTLYHNCVMAEEEAIAKLPSLKDQSKGLYDSVRAILKSRVKTVPFDVYEERVAICEGCEFLWPGMEERLRCSKCGCFMKNKARFEALHCPIKKW